MDEDVDDDHTVRHASKKEGLIWENGTLHLAEIRVERYGNLRLQHIKFSFYCFSAQIQMQKASVCLYLHLVV